MWTFNKKKSRLLAGFMALVLVFSNIAANVQTVYAFGPAFHLGDNGEWESAGNQESDGSGDLLDDMGAGVTADDAGAYDFYVSIWPEMEKSEDAEDEEAEEDAAAAETWTGKWLQYMYDGQETDHTLGQELLMSGKYEEEYGPLDMNLPGTWEGDNDDVMEVYPDGTALVKDEGIVNVTFTYEGEAVTAAAAEDVPAEGSGTAAPSEEATVSGGEENVSGEGQTVGDPQTVSDEQPADGETAETVTTAAEETEADAESETETETETETVVETEVETETEAEAETEVETETEAEAETEVETETETEAETTASADVSTAAPENEEETESAAVKETEAEATESSTEAITEGEVPLAALDSAAAPTEAASEDSSDETESVPEATGNNAIQPETPEVSGTPEASETPEAPAEESKKTLEPGTVLTWVVCVKYSGPALMANEGTLTCDGNNIPQGNWTVGDGVHNVVVTGTWNGTITYTGYGTMTISGGGTINASGYDKSAITVDSSSATVRLENATVTGGKGTKITNTGMEPRNNGEFRVGGGVYVKAGTFVLAGGTIRNNTAQRGGGIFVNEKAYLTMTGGTVKNNSTVDNERHTNDHYNLAGEGGGIFVYGTATISGGQIINNICNSKTDIGGGGLYVNNGGIATLFNAKITGNTADGWGGGIAGCCHGEMSLVATDGAALFDNTANGTTHTKSKYWTGCDTAARDHVAEVVDHYNESKVQGLNASNTMDFYTAGSTIISNYMAGGGSANYTAKFGAASVYNVKDNEVLKKENTNIGLVAHPSDTDKAKVPGGVLIQGNTSTVHGGGIGCNGGLYFGSSSNLDIITNVLDLTLTAEKTLSGATLTNGAYTFELLYSDMTRAKTAQNGGNGTISFHFDNYDDISSKFKEDGNGKYIEFYLREIEPSTANSDIMYDKSMYKLHVPLSCSTSTKTETLKHTTDSNKNEIKVTYTVHTYTAGKITLQKVTDKKGNTLNSPQSVSGSTPEFTNAKALANFEITKEFTGIDENDASLNGKTFTFTLQGTTLAGVSEKRQITVSEATDWKGKVEKLPFGIYTITESDTDVPGFTFKGVTYSRGDSNSYVTFDKAKNQITLDMTNWDGNTATVKFTATNDYLKQVSFTPKAKKQYLEGSDNVTVDKEFTFNLAADNSNQEGAVLPTPATATVTGAGEVDFGAIQFTEAGTYKFTITEVDGHLAGYEYDNAQWTLTVVVEAENKELKVKSHSYQKVGGAEPNSDYAIFKNKYTLTSDTSYAPEIAKVIAVDTPPTNKKFDFTLKPVETNPEGYTMPETTDVQIEGAGTATFGAIKFTQAGTYNFTIEEVKPANAESSHKGYTFDETVWTLTVVVEDKDSRLEVSSHTYSSDDKATVNDKATFTNDYNVEPTHFQPEVEKLFTGNSDPRPQDYIKTFSFTLDGEQDGVTLPESRKATVTSKYVSGANKGKFDEITFTKAGTYTFTITEDALNEQDYLGYGHDDSVWTLTVVVEDVDSKLVVKSHTYKKAGLVIPSIYATFTNSYDAQPITYQPKATKQVVGEVIPNQKYFQFTLEAAESNPEGVKWDAAVKDGVDSISVYGLPDYQISQGTFHPVSFEKAGTYMFNILEENTHEAGYTYDSRLWRLTVEVVDKDGQLEVKSAVYDVTGADGRTVFYSDVEDFSIVGEGATARFVNGYKPAPTHYAPEVMKLIYGNTMPPEDRTYTFVLEHGFWYPNGVLTDAGAVIPEDPTATVVGVGRGKFNEIEFTKAGTYNFKVREKDEGGVNGYLYDDTTWNVEVTVVDNDGQLEVTNVHYTKQAGTKTENAGPENEGNPLEDTGKVLFASFYNKYNVLPTETQLHVTKYVTGSVRPEVNTATFNFRLALIDATTRNGATLPEKQTVTITGSGDPGLLGTADFDPIKFTQAGTYIFEIDEMTGFETDTQTMPGYTYDGSTWKVSVEVEDHNGTLVVTKKEYHHLVNGERVDSSDVPAEEGAKFVNDYDVESTKYAPKVNKEFARSAAARPTEETFTFTLEPAADYGGNITFSDAAAAKEVTVTGAGIASFDDITFNEAGTYEFIISETGSGKPGYTYDPVKWKLTVEVIDTGRQAEGVNRSQLMVNTTSYIQIDTDEPESDGEMATFTNDYKVSAAAYRPEVSKALTGAERPSEKTFTFSIADNGYTPPAYALALASGVVMPEKTTTAVTGEGTASFDEIGFTEPGTYKFVIAEMNGGENGYTYDTAVWDLTVEVKDIDGQLTVTGETFEKDDNATVSTERAAFVNDYQVKSTVYAPEVVKTITGIPLWDETFEFELAASADNKEGGVEFTDADSAKHVTVTGAGTARFDEMTFTKAGTYTFTVKETAGNSPYWTYDDRTWTLTVVVEDEDSQLVVKSHSYASNRPTPDTSETAAEFENGFAAPGELRISKTVTGNAGEVRRDFHFTVTLTDLSGNPLKGSYSYTGSSIYGSEDAPADGVITDGVVTVTLRHGQEITFHDVPAGTSYRVEEEEADTEGYRTTLTVDGNGQAAAAAEGTIQIDGTAVVEYENYRYQPTGGTTPGRPGTNIPDNEVPQSPGTPDIITISDEPTPLSNFETIEDEDVPLAFLAPMTGDNKPVGAAALFGLLALGMMGAFGILASRKDEEDA